VTDLKRAHLASERIEANIRQELPHVDRVLIHYEPKVKSMLRYAVPLGDARGNVGEHFGESPYFALVEINLQEMRLSKQDIMANPHKDLAKGKGIKVAQFLLTYKPDVVITRESLKGKGPGYAFAEAGVEIGQTEARTLDELIEGLEKKGTMRIV
jgi:predicted Fe-Mo cluster-binding NifX family protein